MPQQAAVRPAAPRGQPPREEKSFFQQALRGIFMFLAIQFAMRQFMQYAGIGPSAQNATAPSFPSDPSQSTGSEGYEYSRIPQKLFPLWPTDQAVDVSVYLTEDLQLTRLHSPETINAARVFHAENFSLGNLSDSRTVSTEVNFSRNVQQNSTLFAVIVVAKHGAAIDPSQEDFNVANTFRQYKLLTRYLPKKKVVKVKKLIGGSSDGKEDEAVEEETVPHPAGPSVASYWHSNFTINLIGNMGELNYPNMHPSVRQWVNLEDTGARDATGKNAWYYPIAYPNDFWLLRDHMVELNHTVKSLPLHISLANIRPWQFQIYSTLDEGFKLQAKQGGSQAGELEEVKRVLVETNIYLLSTTFAVSILHTIFEMLAFKNDISHWRNKKDNVGISVRTILANVIMQLIIFLYLIDNSDGTSWMILFGQGMGIVLEAWKITKTVDVKVREAPGSLLGYKVTFEDKHKLSETEKKTKEYDQIAFRYLYMIAVPLLLAYAGWSLIYESHKSWYSFIITTLVGSVYAYGFLMMVPSLYINYRLKSVAHMPGKAMMYKFLNTFIDDLFAFTIKMPTLHRLATLRDDVIFFIYLYQSYKYKVDYARVNEFGQGGDEPEEVPVKEIAGSAVAEAEDIKDESAKAVTTSSDEGTGARKRRK